MSMNLNAEVKATGERIDLWQTPTWVSYMCVESWEEDENGVPLQRHWKDTRKLYSDWLRSRLQGVFHDQEEHEDLREAIEDHLERLYSKGELEFWVA